MDINSYMYINIGMTVAFVLRLWVAMKLCFLRLVNMSTSIYVASTSMYIGIITQLFYGLHKAKLNEFIVIFLRCAFFQLV